MSLIEKIINAETGEVTERPYTAEEIAISEANAIQAQKEIAEAAAKEEARKAVFAKLGLTEDELKVLFG